MMSVAKNLVALGYMKLRISLYTLLFVVLLFVAWVPLWVNLNGCLKYVVSFYILLAVAGFALKSETRTYAIGWALLWAGLLHLILVLAAIWALLSNAEC